MYICLYACTYVSVCGCGRVHVYVIQRVCIYLINSCMCLHITVRIFSDKENKKNMIIPVISEYSTFLSLKIGIQSSVQQIICVNHLNTHNTCPQSLSISTSNQHSLLFCSVGDALELQAVINTQILNETKTKSFLLKQMI